MEEKGCGNMKRPFPKIGMRMIKSAVAVLICLLLSIFLDRADMRIYSSIAALLCIQPYSGDTKRTAIQRIVGTAVGSVFGAIAILLEIYLLGIQNTIAGDFLIALLIIPTIWTTVYLDMRSSSYFVTVVFLSITTVHMTDANPWVFVFFRCVETLIGIAVGILINICHLPRRKRRDILFVSGLDGVLLHTENQLTPYSKVQLNRMMDDGMLFTISTMRTPGSVWEASEGLRFHLPVIVMSGAAMYDMKKKAFLKTKVLPKELVLLCCEVLDRHGINCFINGLLNNVLMIYYEEPKNLAEQDIYDKLHTSPYRNYVSRKYYNQCKVLYLMSIDKTERIQEVMDEFQTSGLADQVRIRCYPSRDYPGFSYIKIYEKTVSRQAMLEELKKELGVTRVVTFGGTEEDFKTEDWKASDGNQVVKELEKLYEPLIWKKD